MSLTQHVNFSISLITTSTAQAAFGVPLKVAEHSITANRQDGPYTSLAAVEAAGFTLAAAPAVYGSAKQVFAQRPRTQTFMVGRRLAAEHIVTSLDAIKAEDPATFFMPMLETRTTAEIIAAAGWAASEAKILLAQTSNAATLAGTASTAQNTTFQFGGTETDGTYSIEVIDEHTGVSVGTAAVVRSTTPATNDDLATQMRTNWDLVPALAAISAAAGGATDVVDIDFDGLGNLYSFVILAPAPGTLVPTDTPGTQNLGELMLALDYDNTTVIYHDDDTEHLDASWAGRCLGFNLDAPRGSGSWAHHTPNGITATRLSDAQKTQLKAYNVNWLSPVRYTSGVEEVGFTFPGVAVSGISIKVQTSLFWLQARLEEALLKVFLEVAKTSTPAILYTEEGIALIQGAAQRVFGDFVRFGHGVAGLSEASGRKTPWVDAPLALAVSSDDKAAGRLTQLTAEAIIAPEILSVGDPATVGFTIDLRLA